ncbi:MAG: LytTR family DNA-binding domain-containing protein [Clostridia bacterium]|nr:LytTR family DNA-binding domain-containing protein [Clostridia bacterium]
MVNFVLCEDNKNILNRLEKMLESILIKNNLSGQIVFSTTNPDNFLDYVTTHQFDIVILDIDLKSNLSGIDLANIIRKKNKKAYIVFTTAHLEYMMVAYKYKTFDFLAKPLTAERLEETITRLFEDISGNENSFFKFGNKKEYINTNDIFFIQKQGKKAIFKTYDHDFEITSSFTDILTHLPKNFVRCHKSYIVNVNKISYINSDSSITFSDNFKDQCFIGPKFEHIL